MKIDYNKKDKSVTITTSREREYSELFDDLGDVDIVQANEVRQNYVAMEGSLYNMDDSQVRAVMEGGTTVLTHVGEVKDCGNEEFINWYF